MTAYAVFLRRDYGGVTRMRLADFQSIDPAVTSRELLRWAFARCRAAGIQVLEIVGDGAGAPFRRRLPHWAFYYKTADPALAGILRDPRVWEPSSFDGDASL